MNRGERWLKTIPGLTEHKLKVAYAKSELYKGSLSEVAIGLNTVCERAEQGAHTARDVLLAFVPLIADLEHLPRAQALRTEALAADLLPAGRLLRGSTPEGHLLEQSRSDTHAGVLQRADGRPVTLGERRALARRPSRATLDKLLRDPHPMVVRILLENPRITEEDVVQMAARRPVVPEVIVEVAKLWSRQARVRMAIALNPGSPPAVSVPMLSLMVRGELEQVARAVDLPPVVRATARDLIELRPPMDPVEPPAIKH